MWCPHCQSVDLRVIDSRHADDATRRRRECGNCGRRFTTYERVERFICPTCGSPNSRTTKLDFERGVSWRRRECLACGTRYETRESAVARDLVVVKRDFRREPFRRDKVLGSVRIATAKLPISSDQIESLVDDVIAEISRLALHEVPTVEIGGMVMERLRAPLGDRISTVCQRVRVDNRPRLNDDPDLEPAAADGATGRSPPGRPDSARGRLRQLAGRSAIR